MRFTKGDNVKIIAGDDRGKTGKILKVFATQNRMLVEGIRFVKRHTRRIKQGQQGGILEKEAPIHASNAMLICPKCGRVTSVGKLTLTSGKRARACKQCGEILDKA
jgi:large subunit ribosomal protein L24